MATAGKTYVATPTDVERNWYIVDAEGQTLGRLASRIANVLRGKHKAQFTPHLDTGDYVIVVNASKVAVTGKKLTKKIYYRHSGYPGGLRMIHLKALLERQPEKVIEEAVWGMLPHNRLGRRQIRKLHVYPGGEHPHAAQKPQPLNDIKGIEKR